MWKKFLVGFAVLLIIFGAAGCIKIKKQTSEVGSLGGVFYTEDRFETWKHRSLLMTPGETVGNIADVDVYFMKFDPADEETIYAGTVEDGLYVSYNSGAGWTKLAKLAAGIPRDIAVGPKENCTLLVPVESRLYKSINCGRSWQSIYYTDKAETRTAAVAYDWYEPKIAYLGLSDGSVLKSEDGGVSWKLVDKFDGRIFRIIVDPHHSKNVYVGVEGRGLYKSSDKGVTWTDLNKAMKDFKGAAVYYDIALSASTKDLIVYANKYGLLRSLDGGATWAEIKLLTTPASEQIFALAIDPQNPNYLYYSTNSAVYKSVDAGNNWVVKKMPTTRYANEILVTPKQTSKIFAGVRFPEQK